MLTFAGTLRAIDEFLQPQPPEAATTLQTPLRFDPTLVPRLLSAHEILNARFAALLCMLDKTVPAGKLAFECANLFHELRRNETIWLFPVIGHAVNEDASARGQLMEVRLVAMMLARRTLRYFDELADAIKQRHNVKAAADRVSTTLAEYLRRSETEIYPLYALIGAPRTRRTPRAA